MHGIRAKDGDRVTDWGAVSADYAAHRPSYPPSLFERLERHGFGTGGQRILDLGTGVGFLAREFARRGGRVVGIDSVESQIREARRLAEEEGLSIDYRVAFAEEIDFPPASFDGVTAGQCWLYFDADRVIPRVQRVLAPGGRLVTCHFSWLPRLDRTARETERLVLKHNPDWSAADWSGEIPDEPAWAADRFRVAASFWYDEPVAFTRESWRGRIRACRGVGASLSAAAVRRFDEEHARILEELVAQEFTVLHRVDAHLLEPVEVPA